MSKDIPFPKFIDLFTKRVIKRIDLNDLDDVMETKHYFGYVTAQLVETYEGPLIRVRNGWTDEEKDIGFKDYGVPRCIDKEAISRFATLNQGLFLVKIYNQKKISFYRKCINFIKHKIFRMEEIGVFKIKEQQPYIADYF